MKLRTAKGFVLGFSFAAVLFAGMWYAVANDTELADHKWEAVWHGTGWIFTGKIIEAQKIAENFEYLYQETIKKDDLPECNGLYKKVEIKDGQFVCTDTTPKGCKLKYRIKTSTDQSDWIETDWGVANGGDWVEGAPAFVRGNPTTIQYQLGVMCDDYHAMEIAYNFRGNRGPYTAMGGSTVASKKGQWGYGDWTPRRWISCNIKGGNGGCGTPMDILNQAGPLACDIRARYNGHVAYKPGGWRGPSDRGGTSYGSASANTNCNGKGCSLEMAIKCQ